MGHFILTHVRSTCPPTWNSISINTAIAITKSIMTKTTNISSLAADISRRRSLYEFFATSLKAFQQSSSSSYKTLCTLPHKEDDDDDQDATTPIPAPRKPPSSSSSSNSPLRKLIILDSSFNPPTTAHAAMVKSALRAHGNNKDDVSSSVRVVLLLAVKNADKAVQPAEFQSRLVMMEGFGRGLIRDFVAEGWGDGNSGSAGDATTNATATATTSKSTVEVDVAVTTMPFFNDKARVLKESGFYSYSHDDDGTGIRPGPEAVFLTGYDTLIRILNPKYYGNEPGIATSSSSEAREKEKKKDREKAMQVALAPFFERARVRVTLRPDNEWGSVEEQREWIRKAFKGTGSTDSTSSNDDGGIEGGGVVPREWMDRIEVEDAVEGDAVSSSKVREAIKSGGQWDDMVDEEVKKWIVEEGLYL